MRASRTYGSVRGASSNGRSYRNSRGYSHERVRIVGGFESLSETGTESAIINGASNLQQQIGAAS
jgi:hypothetical protein